jgi:hypothetical protein
MKKQLLTLAFATISSLSFGQFTIGTTSVKFTGHAVPGASSAGQFYDYQPNNSGGSMFSDATCSTPIAQGANAGDLGGFDPNVYDATSVTPARPDGIIFYGGKIARVYYGAPCSPNDPSFGFHTGTSSGIGSGTNVDLSATANQKISFSYTSDATMTVYLQLLDQNYVGKLDDTKPATAISLVGDGASHTVSIDFSSAILGGADMTNVRQVSFIYSSTTLSPNFGIALANIKLGSAVTAVNPASYMVTSAVVYPNPASSSATLSMELKSNANVKVIISDLMGREMKVVSEGNFASTTETFSVADLAKGLYKVTYLVDGVPAQTQSLMVK